MPIRTPISDRSHSRFRQTRVPFGALCVGVLLGVGCFALGGCGGSSGGQAGSTGIPAATLDTRQCLDPIPSLTNSPDTLITVYALAVHPTGQGGLTGSATVANSSIARATISGDPLTVSVTPLALGTTTVTVVVYEGNNSAMRSFQFSVQEFAKPFTVAAVSPANDAIELANSSDRTVDISLSHNDFPLFRTRAEIVAFVKAMPELMAGEPFERKLWRFLVNNVTHWLPTSASLWLDDPLILVNSIGWGLCSHVSGAYVSIAREAGLQSRVWALSEHVVPEVFVNGRWHMYDPDLAVCYLGRDGEVAGVEDLVADPALISAPVNPIYPSRVNTQMYSRTVADIYGTAAGNWIADATVVSTSASPSGLVELPARSTLTYPGVWTEQPTGYDGTVAYPVTYFKQARLELPGGWTGTVNLPWVPWKNRGQGSVSIGGVAYDAGSQGAGDALRSATSPVADIGVSSYTEMSIIFFVNAVQYAMQLQNKINVSWKDV